MFDPQTLQDLVLRSSQPAYPNDLGWAVDGGNDDAFTGNVVLFPGVFLMYAD